MLSGRGLCDELITRPEEFYRLWCVVVCDQETSRNEEAMTRVGSQRHSKKKIKCRGDDCQNRNSLRKKRFVPFLLLFIKL